MDEPIRRTSAESFTGEMLVDGREILQVSTERELAHGAPRLAVTLKIERTERHPHLDDLSSTANSGLKSGSAEPMSQSGRLRR